MTVKAEGTRGAPLDKTEHTYQKRESTEMWLHRSCSQNRSRTLAARGQSEVALGLGNFMPSVELIETAWRWRDGRKQNIQCRIQAIRASAVKAAVFTKGWVGVPPHPTRTAR